MLFVFGGIMSGILGGILCINFMTNGIEFLKDKTIVGKILIFIGLIVGIIGVAFCICLSIFINAVDILHKVWLKIGVKQGE